MARLPRSNLYLLLGTISFAEPFRVPFHSTGQARAKAPATCWGFRLVIFPSGHAPQMAAAGDPGAGSGDRVPAAPAVCAHSALPRGRSGLDSHVVAMGQARPGRAHSGADRSCGVNPVALGSRRGGRAFLQPSRPRFRRITASGAGTNP